MLRVLSFFTKTSKRIKDDYRPWAWLFSAPALRPCPWVGCSLPEASSRWPELGASETRGGLSLGDCPSENQLHRLLSGCRATFPGAGSAPSHFTGAALIWSAPLSSCQGACSLQLQDGLAHVDMGFRLPDLFSGSGSFENHSFFLFFCLVNLLEEFLKCVLWNVYSLGYR